MLQQYQRVIIIGVFMISLLVVVILFGTADYNHSSATSVAGVSVEMLPYYNSLEYVPSEENPVQLHTILFFSATWDSYSMRVSDLLRAQLQRRSDLQVVELDISTFRVEADKRAVTQPPMAILLSKQGAELGRTSSASVSELEKLLSLLPKN